MKNDEQICKAFANQIRSASECDTVTVVITRRSADDSSTRLVIGGSGDDYARLGALRQAANFFEDLLRKAFT